MIILSGIQILVLMVITVGVPAVSFLWYRQSKSKLLAIIAGSSENRRRLVEEENTDYHKIKPVNWSSISSGWNKGRKVDFERQHIPLIAILEDHRAPGSWKQANRIGASELIHHCKSYLDKFGSSTFTIAAVSDEDSARNIAWGLANYLTSETSRVLVFEISPRSKRGEESTIIELGSKNFDEFPDPRKTQFSNVDMVTFNSAYNWPEDILKDQLVHDFCALYKESYEVILIIAPPILKNGFARKAAKASDGFILAADANDDAADLQDAYLRITHTCKESNNESLVIWGVLEK